jgi:Flp pilus assembly pilin Flp
MIIYRSIAPSAFWASEEGAVTVEWVVLTAAIVGLAMLALTPVATGTNSMSASTTSYIDNVSVGYSAD